jgi:hypothetical protein
MSQHPGRGPEHAVRALLEAASDHAPPTTDLLHEVRRRVRRRSALVPSLAGLAAVGVLAVAVMTASTVTGTPPASARERVAAAAARTAQDSYRVHLASRKSNGSYTSARTAVGVFDPNRRTGRLEAQDGGLEVRYVGDMVYRQLSARPVGRLPGASTPACSWLASRQEGAPEGISELAEFDTRALQHPQQALGWLRSAGDVREQGPVSGDGWAGVRYAFELTDRLWRVTGTVDVDADGRVRRLEATSRSTDTANGLAGTVHGVLEFRDFGVRAQITAPPADQVCPMPTRDEIQRERDRIRKATRG